MVLQVDNTLTKSHIIIRSEEKVAVILVGNSGAGKSTFKRSLAQLGVGFGYLGTGDLLRAYIKKHPAFGKMIETYTSVGEHVPNEILMPLVKEWFEPLSHYCIVVLDGFPRNLLQIGDAFFMLHQGGFIRVIVLYIDTHPDKCAKHLMMQAEESKGERDDGYEAAFINRLAKFEEKVKPTLVELEHRADVYKRIDTETHNLQDVVVVRDIAREVGIIF